MKKSAALALVLLALYNTASAQESVLRIGKERVENVIHCVSPEAAQWLAEAFSFGPDFGTVGLLVQKRDSLCQDEVIAFTPIRVLPESERMSIRIVASQTVKGVRYILTTYAIDDPQI